jgi:hypothetical protein
LILNHLTQSVSSPEKAGVGGSIPSLATTFLRTYAHPKSETCSILFQKQFQARRGLSPFLEQNPEDGDPSWVTGKGGVWHAGRGVRALFDGRQKESR